MAVNDKGYALDWDSEIQNDGQNFELLPEGTYTFRVDSLEKGSFSGSEKMAPCPKATLRFSVKNVDNGKEGTVFDHLFLNSKAEWKLSQFFKSIGMKKTGEKIHMPWNDVEGAEGKMKISIQEYNGKKNNQVEEYLNYEPPKFVAGKF